MSSHRMHMISFTSASRIRSSPLSHNLPTPFISHCTHFCFYVLSKILPSPLFSPFIPCSHSQDDIPVLGRPFHALCSSFRLSGVCVRTEGNDNRSSQVTLNGFINAQKHQIAELFKVRSESHFHFLLFLSFHYSAYSPLSFYFPLTLVISISPSLSSISSYTYLIHLPCHLSRLPLCSLLLPFLLYTSLIYDFTGSFVGPRCRIISDNYQDEPQ